MRLAFDFDGIFIDKPPFIPKEILEKLHKKKSHNLSYRFPGKIEQKIRVLSHAPFFRPPIKNNIESLKRIVAKGNSKIYLVSSRFSFLKSKTELWDSVNNIFKYFEKAYFNFEDEQPHIFKDKVIKKEKLEKFVDDDLDLLLYLSPRNPEVKFYWVNRKGIKRPLPENITHIKNLDEFFDNYV